MKVTVEAFCAEHKLPLLPQWVELEDQVSTVTVRLALHEKLASFCELLAQLIWPEGIISLAEAGVLTEKEREHIHKLHDRFMLLEKDCLMAELVSTPEQDLVLIMRLYKEWPMFVRELQIIIEKTKAAYNGHRQGASDLSYMG